ncbi:MAG: zinc ribbon domain-containing protein [Clostridiales bacterium]|nr:zinc ribbon domain-containing protein [Clostridiales bacterium]
MFCHNCGSKLIEGAAFCSACGEKVQASAPGVCTACGATLPEGAEFCISCGTAVDRAAPKPVETSRAAAPEPSPGGAGLVGFSDRIISPEAIEYIKQSKKSARGCAFVLVPLPFIIYMIVSFVSDEVETADALVFGGGISVAFLLFFLLIQFITNAKRSWDGIVTDKQSFNKTKLEHDRTNDTSEVVHYTDYVLTFRTDKGKKDRCVERLKNNWGELGFYPYLNVGDRVRYYPQLPYKYEKYDKSRDSEIPCMFCKTFNDINNDKCGICGKQLFK